MSNYNHNEDRELRSARRRKVQNFSVNLSENNYDDDYSFSDPDYDRGMYDNEINSYSGEDVKEQMEENSRRYLKSQKKRKKKEEKLKNKKNRRIFRFIWLVSGIIVGAVLSVYLLVGLNDMLAINRQDDATVALELHESPNLDYVAQELGKAGVIKEPSFFKMYAFLTKSGNNFNQGSFDIKTNLDYEAIINYLQGNSNRKDIIKVTITEGQSVLEIADTLSNAGVLSDKQKFLELCNSTYFDEDFSFLKEVENPDKCYYKLEGYLYPDTYDFYVNEDPEVSITRFLNNFENQMYSKKTIDDYDTRVKISDLIAETDYSMGEILTIASIIQAEAASNEDMYYISSILHNRLDYGADYGVASLGLDSTKYYPYRSEDAVPANQRDNYKSRYDTYDFDGLPPGPICNPGTQAILAAINPKSTDYLYFCHSGDGTPYYAETLYGHNYNLSLAGG